MIKIVLYRKNIDTARNRYQERLILLFGYLLFLFFLNPSAILNDESNLIEIITSMKMKNTVTTDYTMKYIR